MGGSVRIKGEILNYVSIFGLIFYTLEASSCDLCGLDLLDHSMLVDYNFSFGAKCIVSITIK